MSLLSKFLDKRSQNSTGGEMGFTDHLEALRWHILRSLIALLVGAIFVYLNIKFIFDKIILGPTREDFIAYKFLCYLGKLVNVEGMCLEGVAIKFQNIKLSGQFMMGFSSAAMIGFILVFPYILWEFWRFVKPALKPNEAKHARGIVLWGSLLFILGVCFSYFIIVPFTISFFTTYTLSDQFENIPTIADYYDTMSDLILGTGMVFEIPILVYFLSKIGILTPQVLKNQRRIAVVIILVLAAIITPPDWFSIFLIFLPLYGLYEASILVSARINKKREKEEGVIKDLDW